MPQRVIHVGIGVWGKRWCNDFLKSSVADGTIEVACNVADPAESDLTPKHDAAPHDELTAAGWAGRPVWFYLLVSVSLLIPAEWLLYQRRWIQ